MCEVKYLAYDVEGKLFMAEESVEKVRLFRSDPDSYSKNEVWTMDFGDLALEVSFPNENGACVVETIHGREPDYGNRMICKGRTSK